MTKVLLGIEPDYVEIPLPKRGDYECEITYEVDDVVTNWPVGTALSLVFANGVTFSATVSGATATFAEDKAVIAALPEKVGVSLVYTNGTTDRVLMIGMAKVLEMSLTYG